MLKIMLIAATVTFAGSAMADEVVIQRNDPAPVTSKTVVEHHDDLGGCSSKTVHKEDGMGDSKTVKKSDC